ncbi:histidine kinase dimerization/phospho-acceptor domain-containing protein, partial [Microbacteriaceae bacterium 4G12]
MKKFYISTKKRIGKSLRTQLILTFFVCTFAAIFTAILLAPLFENANRHAVIDYTTEMEHINFKAQQLADILSTQNKQQPETISVQERLDAASNHEKFKILLVTEDGTVLYKTKQATETQVDIHNIIRNAMDLKIHQDINQRKEFISFYPVELEEKKMYLVVSGIPQGEITYVTSGSPMAGIIGFALFLILFYIITKKKMKQLEAMTYGIEEISKGNLQYRISFKSEDEIGTLANNINHMAEQLAQKIEEERRAEQTKNELITNVSHDLRTPLTSIMGYLRLLRDKKYETDVQVEEYISIASNKSEQLKRLIEDLFEYT